jgi:transposase-like protein
MTNSAEFPKRLLQATRYFADIDVCVDFVASMRWPGGVTCPHCDSKKVSYLSSRRIWKCMAKECHKQFSVKTGSVFEDSAIPLDKWMTAVWLIVNCKNGISSYEIARDLKVTQKSAWFMLHRIRLAMKDGSFEKLGGDGGGPIEIDETFVGGKVKNMHKSKRPTKTKGMQGGAGKAIVLGMLQRGGMVRAKVIMDRTKQNVDPVISEHVAPGSHIMTDEFSVYPHLSNEYVHEIINHLEGYVREHVHTNSIENFWSLLKRGLNGTYVSVEPFHLEAYVDEQTFRFNNRATKDNPLNDADRFLLAVSQIAGKRLTYAELTGKTDRASSA